jgi:hypothetical protein
LYVLVFSVVPFGDGGGAEQAQVTADGVPVLWHDDYVVTRAPGGALEQQHVAQLTLAGFKRLARPAPQAGAPADAGAGADAAGAPPAEAACRADGGAPELMRLFHDGAGGRAAAPAPWAVEEDDELPTLAEVFEARACLPYPKATPGARADRPACLMAEAFVTVLWGASKVCPCSRAGVWYGPAMQSPGLGDQRWACDRHCHSARVGHQRAASNEAGRPRAPGRAGGGGLRHRGQAGDAGRPGGHARRRGGAHGRPNPGRGALPCARGTLCAAAPYHTRPRRGALPMHAPILNLVRPPAHAAPSAPLHAAYTLPGRGALPTHAAELHGSRRAARRASSPPAGAALSGLHDM